MLKSREVKKKTKPNPMPPEPEKLNIALEGGAGKDTLFGTRGNDTLSGGAGDDILAGKNVQWLDDGDDQLFGGEGDDLLYGATGNDRFDGGEGSDTVTMDPDVVGLIMRTRVGAKIDLSITGEQNTRYGLDTFTSVENLIGTGKADRFLGNGESNGFWGQAGNDRLFGRGGDDLLVGGEGRDTLVGETGADTLVGGAGNDVLTGGAGDDVFEFTLKLKAKGGVDRIVDFTAGEDKIALMSPALNGSKSNGMLALGAFRAGAEAQDADDRIIYDAQTGILSYDADGSGSGAALAIARLAKGLSLTNEDFIL